MIGDRLSVQQLAVGNVNCSPKYNEAMAVKHTHACMAHAYRITPLSGAYTA